MNKTQKTEPQTIYKQLQHLLDCKSRFPDAQYTNLHGITFEMQANEKVNLTYESPEGVQLEKELDSYEVGDIESIKPDDFYRLMLIHGDLWVNAWHSIGLAGESFYTKEQLAANPLIEWSRFTQDFAIQNIPGTYLELVPTSTFRCTQDIINFFKEDAED